jgi:hypothetical protein
MGPQGCRDGALVVPAKEETDMAAGNVDLSLKDFPKFLSRVPTRWCANPSKNPPLQLP